MSFELARTRSTATLVDKYDTEAAAVEAEVATSSPQQQQQQQQQQHSPRQLECTVCFEHQRNTLLPCGHAILCESCAESTIQGSALCPMCRQLCTTAWVGSDFIGADTFVQIDDHNQLNDKYKVIQRETPLPSIDFPALSLLATTNRRARLHSQPCQRAACVYMAAFAVSIVLVFVGAVTTNWHCEKRQCLCAKDLTADDEDDRKSFGMFSFDDKEDSDANDVSQTRHANVTCALICSCLDLEEDRISTVNVTWGSPESTGNTIETDDCLPDDSPADLYWAPLCEQVKQTRQYQSGACLSDPESQEPCGNRKATGYFLFTIGWYSIVLLTNILFFVCFCFCLGMCRAQRRFLPHS